MIARELEYHQPQFSCDILHVTVIACFLFIRVDMFGQPTQQATFSQQIVLAVRLFFLQAKNNQCIYNQMQRYV